LIGPGTGTAGSGTTGTGLIGDTTTPASLSGAATAQPTGTGPLLTNLFPSTTSTVGTFA
jgi:hypothetical protein